MAANQKSSAYQELVELIAHSDPQRVLAFRFSAKTAQRVETLIAQEKSGKISSSEKEELDIYMHLNRIVMLAQAQAHKLLHGQSTSKAA
jgi:hypothetical protein